MFIDDVNIGNARMFRCLGTYVMWRTQLVLKAAFFGCNENIIHLWSNHFGILCKDLVKLILCKPSNIIASLV